MMDSAELAQRRDTVEARPEDPVARHDLALALARSERHEEALEHFEEACRQQPNHPQWHYNRGLSWQMLEDWPQAVVAYREAINGAPELFPAWVNLAYASNSIGLLSNAEQAARQAIALQPENPGGHRALGSALWGAGDLAGAAAAFHRARECAPEDWSITLNLANTLKHSGQVNEAIGLLRGMVLAKRDWPEAHRDLAQALLLNGEFEEGWRENQWRWGTSGMVRRKFGQPEWDGESLEGKTILLHAEQGFGDALQFVRYAPLVADRGARVVLECPPALERLFNTVPGVEQVVARGEPLLKYVKYEVHCPLLELPRIFGTTLETIPTKVPYVSAKNSLPKAEVPRVGLAWAGSERSLNNRSLDLKHLEPLLACPGVEWWSLQLGGTAALKKQGWVEIQDKTEFCGDFADTAGLLMGLDLVVTVDTSVAHLAGALGQPAWVLLGRGSDWRWLQDREDSPWYPTLRLFRQGEGEEWSDVVERLRRALQAGHF